jgi:hypothetical protein
MATIESYIRPATLYRYRSLRHFDREVAAIRNATLHCAPYSALNDPMEGFYISSKRLRESENYKSIRALIADNKAMLGICSFSEVHNNELMWAHYADQFRGICVAYRFSGLLSNLGEDTEFIRLSYRENAPTVLSKKEPEYLAKRVLSCKNYRWLYEREWRMFAPKGTVTYERVKCVQCVYLGSRIDADNSTKLKTIMRGLGIEVRTMSLDKYSMSFDTCR